MLDPIVAGSMSSVIFLDVDGVLCIDNTLHTFKVKIKTNKTKSIIEKNIKNEIVKYQIDISSSVEFYNFETGVLFTNTFSEKGNFNVGNKNIDTRNSEKKLVEDLTEKISKKIIKRLRLD